MGFEPGTRIRLDNALLIIKVRSANDVATTIAEGIGGSVEDFVAMIEFSCRAAGHADTYFHQCSLACPMRAKSAIHGPATWPSSASALWR